MKKILFFQILSFFYASTNFGQRITSVTISTTTPLREALHTCKIAAEVEGFFSIDYDEKIDSFSSIALFFGHDRIEIDISASVSNNKTEMIFKIPHIKSFVGYLNIIKSYVKKLQGRLENINVGEYLNVKE